MRSIKRWIRNYFNFTQRETNGFILLLLLLGLVVLFPFLWEVADDPYNPAADQKLLDSLADQLKTKPYEPYRRNRIPVPAKPVPPELLRPFDPNALTQQQWEQLGLPAFVAKRLLTYRDKAKGFKYKEQLERIYGFPPELFAQLEPYISLPARKTGSAYPAYPNKKYSNRPYTRYPERERAPFTRKIFRLQPFDINAADTAQLKKIRGIGSKLSARIVKFRDKLGGFESVGQLQQVYGLSPEVIDSLRKYTFVSDTFKPGKLNINSATMEQLRQHPYLGFNLARHIIAYRTQHGPFQTLDDLRNIKTLDEATFQKIKPYLTL